MQLSHEKYNASNSSRSRSNKLGKLLNVIARLNVLFAACFIFYFRLLSYRRHRRLCFAVHFKAHHFNLALNEALNEKYEECENIMSRTHTHTFFGRSFSFFYEVDST